MVKTEIIVKEQLLLACLLNSRDPYLSLSVENCFSEPLSQAIFYGIQSTAKAGLGMLPDNILKYAVKKHSSVTRTTIERLIEKPHDLNGFELYYEDCRKTYAQSQIQDHILKDALVEASSKDGLSIEGMEAIVRKIQDNLEVVRGSGTKILSGRKLAEAQNERYQLRKEGHAKYTTGDAFLDKQLITGCAPGEISTIFGASGSGKSAKVMNNFSGLINKRVPCALFTLEMSAEASLDRLTSIRSGLPMEKFYKAQEDDGYDLFFYEEARRIQSLLAQKDHFRVIDDPSISMSTLENYVIQLQRIFRSKYVMCIIDLGTMLKELSSGKPQEIEYGMNILSEVAKRTGVHFMLVVQASRSADSANVTCIDHLDRLRPTQNDIKNSAAIYERSRLVISTFRPKFYAMRIFGKDDEEVQYMKDIMEITIQKQSNGAVGQRLQYIYHAPTFRCLPYREEPVPIIEEAA